MVAYKAAQTASFIRSPDPAKCALLVYGPDAALVSERARELARNLARASNPEAEVVRIDDRDLGEHPERLAVELQTRSMFAERRIVHVRAERRLRPEDLKQLIGGELSATLIVEAGNLRPTSALRKLFEKAPAAAALPCYVDAARDIGAAIESEFSAAGVKLSREARAVLMSRLGSDLGQARSECAKLATYAGAGNEITVADIEAVTGDIGAGLLDALAAATAEGRTGAALKQLDALTAGGQSAHAALAALNRHFTRLHRLCAAVEGGEPARAAIGKFKPPLHFSQRDALVAQSRKWSRPLVASALQSLRDATVAVRLTPALDNQLTQRLVMALSRKAS